ncbi:serine/threonine-protein kinase [Enhygromyxa salina]|nr:serine/threonine-protein kinase [Enhygromyxa salina]
MLANRYEIIGRVGHGATGTVYRAHDHILDRPVAIKLLQPGELAVAEREAQVLAKVAHRNVVTIHDFGHDPGHGLGHGLGHELGHGSSEASGHRYLVLELLEGVDFRAWLSRRPPSAQIIERFIEAGRGLNAAHQAGLVHRDFKPSNVILTDEGRVVVIDFGLARHLVSLDEEVEPCRFAEGTLAYMAPERLAGHDNDERSDQFSFCVALWEALAGTNPFVGDDPLARYRSIRAGRAHLKGRVGMHAQQVPRHIIEALERGMEFDSAGRFSTLGELLGALDRPAPANHRPGRRPLLTALAIGAAFALGWGFVPEAPTVDVAHSSLDPRADFALTILESARKRAADGDARSALNDLLYAAELITAAGETGPEFCVFGGMIPDVADLMVEQGGLNEARMAYAIAISFAKPCENISKTDLLARRESARAKSAI